MTGILTPDQAAALQWWIVGGVGAAIAMGLAVFGIFAFLLFKSGTLKHPAPLIIAISLLTAVALIGALVSQSTDAYNLAAVGIGALAGSLAAVYRGGDNDPSD